MARMVIDPETCMGCKVCVEMCPNKAISMNDDKAGIDQNLCKGAGICASVCPVEAIREEVEGGTSS